jgi:ABC-2 type transport system ATP-binding protein
MLPLPVLLLLDEPESGLDPVQRANLRTRIKTMEKDGTTVIVSSHDISGVCLTASELWLIHRERLTSIDISQCESLTDVMSRLPNEWRASL